MGRRIVPLRRRRAGADRCVLIRPDAGLCALHAHPLAHLHAHRLGRHRVIRAGAARPHGIGLRSTLGRQRERALRIRQRRREIQADVAAAELMAGKRRGEDEQGVRVRDLAPQETGEGGIQRPEPAARDPLCEQGVEPLPSVGGHVRATADGRDGSETGNHASSLGCAPLKSRSSASISARGGRSQCSPWLGAARPRRKRYTAPPTCRS